MRPIIDAHSCTGCGACQAMCPAEVITLVDGVAVIGDGCMECVICAAACPVDAIGPPLRARRRMSAVGTAPERPSPLLRRSPRRA